MDKLFENLSFQTLFDSAADAILIVDIKGKVAKANYASLELLKYKKEEIFGLPVESLMPERFRAPHHAHGRIFSKILKKDLWVMAEICLRLPKQGKKSLSISG